MIHILEQKIPTEITMNVMKFCRHPTAEMLQPLVKIHEEHKVGLRAYCEKRGVPDTSHVLEFPLTIFLERRIQKGKRNGVNPRTTVLSNNKLVDRYC